MHVKLRDILNSEETALNAWLNIGHSFSAEIMAAQDFDALTIDVQHGPQDYSNLLPMIQTMSGYGKTIMARVPWNDPVWIMKFLDAGAMGIICPMINTAEQAAEFVSYLRYPPLGQRSWGPTRAIIDQPDYSTDGANAAVLAFAMIETGEAVDNLDAIAATPHLDALYIGPSDLSLDMSKGALRVGLDREEPEMIETIQGILKTAHAHGKKAALHCGTVDYARRAAEWGFDMVTVGTDSAILVQGAKATVAAFREN